MAKGDAMMDRFGGNNGMGTPTPGGLGESGGMPYPMMRQPGMGPSPQLLQMLMQATGGQAAGQQRGAAPNMGFGMGGGNMNIGGGGGAPTGGFGGGGRIMPMGGGMTSLGPSQGFMNNMTGKPVGLGLAGGGSMPGTSNGGGNNGGYGNTMTGGQSMLNRRIRS